MDMIAAVLAVAEPLFAIAGITPTLPDDRLRARCGRAGEVANTMLSVGASLEQIANALDFMGQC